MWVVAIGVVLGLVVYLGYQARFLLLGPQVSLEPVTTSTPDERTVTLSGSARNIARITVNGRQVFTDPEGRFNEPIVLSNGYNVVTVAAVDRYGRTTAHQREYVYKPTSLIQ